jgi:3-dehydroquinate dehydratase-1
LKALNVESTPDETVIVDRLSRAQALGADIAKIVVIPKDYRDVLTLLNATLSARAGSVRISHRGHLHGRPGPSDRDCRRPLRL